MTSGLYLIALVLAADNDWCDVECFERSHPVASMLGLVGGLDLAYSATAAEKHVQRIELGWVVPFGEQLEVTAAGAYSTDGHFELVPGVRYAMFSLGTLAIPGVSVSTPLWWRQGALQLHVRAAAELRVGPAVTQIGVDVDAGVMRAQLWVGARLSL